jgi:hypothetical protein
MLAPSKTISIEESTLNKASILGLKLDEDVGLIELYKTVKKDFSDLSEFVDALDLLFILGKLDFDAEQGVIKIA